LRLWHYTADRTSLPSGARLAPYEILGPLDAAIDVNGYRDWRSTPSSEVP